MRAGREPKGNARAGFFNSNIAQESSSFKLNHPSVSAFPVLPLILPTQIFFLFPILPILKSLWGIIFLLLMEGRFSPLRDPE